MQLSRRFSPTMVLAAALVAGLAVLVAAEPALAKSSLGIGSAEVTMQPSGPFASLFVAINSYQRAFFTSLRMALVGMKNGRGGGPFLIALSFAYGIFHAAGPGHGKAVISSYMLANEVQLRRGIALSFVSSLLQATTAILAVGAGWFLLRGTAYSMTDATDALEMASYALIAVFGAYLTIRKVARIWRRRAPAAALGFAAAGRPATAGAGANGGGLLPRAMGSGRPALKGSAGATRAAMSASRSAIMQPASAGFAAEVCTDEEEDCGCGRAHMPDPAALGAQRLSFGSAVSAVFAVGLRPCSGAIVVLTFALLNGLYAGGLLSVLAMAMGTAITVSAIAALAVFAKDVALRFTAAGGVRQAVLDGVEVTGALLVLGLGLVLLGSAVT